jgi:C1A family cysteine protease
MKPFGFVLFYLGVFSISIAAVASIDIKKEDFVNNVYSEIYKRTKNIKVDDREKKEPKQESLNSGSRGKMILERIKAKNREKLARMRGLDPRKIKSGADIIKNKINDNKKLLLYANKLRNELETIENRVVSNTEWKARFKEIKKKWDEQKQKYLSKIKVYAKGLSDIPLIMPVDEKEKKKKVEIQITKEFQIVKASFDVPVKDQSMRATCSAFTGARILEIDLHQKGQKLDLSEQYLYWASKGNCQRRPCSKRGSWIGYGFNYSKSQRTMDIPLEKDCPYSTYTKRGNETQTPMKNSCKKGRVKVKSFSYLKTLDQVVTALSQNKAVVASVKLTPNFYENNGLILSKEKLIGRKMDSHAFGHSIVLNGIVKLPKALNEGSYCFVTTNSWGKGWGFGGYSCLSEKWLLSQRQSNPFVTVRSINK